MERRWWRLFVDGICGPWALPAVMLAALTTFCLAKAAAVGTHCGDDAYFASVAKNVVFGVGYGTTVGGDGFILFDPEIGLGPTIILPTAAGIALFGNRPWVPGCVAIAIWTTLAVLVFRRWRRTSSDTSPAGLRDAAILFLAWIPLLYPYHFESWFALLGEVPAALFLLLGFVILSAESPSVRTVCLASLACSAAVLSKVVTLPGYVALLFALVVRMAFVERRGTRTTLIHLAASLLAFLGPIVLFELAKVVGFGGFGPYGKEFARKLSFIGRQGLPSGLRSGLLARAVVADVAVAERFGISVFQLLIAAAVAFAVVVRSGRRSLVWAAVPIASTIGMTAVWFLFLSMGWPRYFLIAIVLASALVAIAVASMEARLRVPVTLAALAYICFVNSAKLPYLAHGLENGWFQPSNELRRALATAAMIDEAVEKPGNETVFLTQWWGTTADVDYYSSHVGVFERYTRLGDRTDFTVVCNKRFQAKDEAFERLLARCEPADEEPGPLMVFHSRPARPADPETRTASSSPDATEKLASLGR